METSRHQPSPARTWFLGLGRRRASLSTPFPQRVHPPGHLLPVSARPASGGLPWKRPAATFFPSSTWGRSQRPLPGGKEGRAEQAEGGSKRRCQAIIPPMGSEHGHHSEIKSPFFKKKIKIKTQTIHVLAKENEELLHWKLLYNNKMRTALVVGRQTRGRVPGRASCPGQDTDMPDATALLWLQ